MTVDPINTIHNSVVPYIEPKILNVSVAKIKRAVAYFFSTLFLMSGLIFAGAAAMGISGPWLLLSIPCILLSICLFNLSKRFYDYENPKELQEIQEVLRNNTLGHAIKAHGLTRIFYYKLLSEEDFARKFNGQAQLMSVNQLAKFYAQVLGAVGAAGDIVYSVPGIKQFREKFTNETRNMRCIEILTSYSLDELSRYELIDQDSPQIQLLIKLKDQYCEAQRCRGESNSDLSEKAYQIKLDLINQECDKAREQSFPQGSSE